MWVKTGQGLLRSAFRLCERPPTEASFAVRRVCSNAPSSPSSSSPSLPSNNSSPSPAYPRAIVAAGSASAADTAAVGEGLVFDDPPPPPLQADPTLLQPRVVVYDGVCHLCHAGVKWVIKADKYKKIKFCCLQSKAAEPYLKLCGLDREDVFRRFLFVEGLYSHYQGFSAALKVASYLPLPYSALSVLLVVPAPLRDFAYDYVAKRRYHWFGKEDECMVIQEKEMLDRFIDRDELFGSKKNEFS